MRAPLATESKFVSVRFRSKCSFGYCSLFENYSPGSKKGKRIEVYFESWWAMGQERLLRGISDQGGGVAIDFFVLEQHRLIAAVVVIAVVVVKKMMKKDEGDELQRLNCPIDCDSPI